MLKRKYRETCETETKTKFYSYKKAKKIVNWARNFPIKNFYVPQNITPDRFFSSYGPRNGIFFIGDSNEDEITEEQGALNKLNVIFKKGINVKNCSLAIGDFIPYFKEKYNEDLIRGDVTNENALSMTHDFTFTYVIDASREKKIISFPLIPANTKNPKFFMGADFDCGCNSKSFLILSSSLHPQFILGAFAHDALAYSLNISDNTLIVNPNYNGSRLEEIKNELKITSSRKINECHMTYPDYASATEAYYLSRSHAIP